MENDEAIQGIADCFLGYERPFNVSSVMYLAPMGIPDKAPEHSKSFMPTTIKPVEKDLPKAIVRLSTAEYSPKYEFKAALYKVPDHFPKRYAAMRIRTDLFDIVYRMESRAIEFKPVNLADDTLKVSIKELRNFIEYIAETIEQDSTYIEVAPSDGTSPLKIKLGTNVVTVPEDFEELRTALNATFLKLASLGLADEVMHPSHLFTRRGHFEFLLHIGKVYEPPILIEFQTDEEVQACAEVTIFNSPIELEGKTLLLFAAFYGKVEQLGGGKLLGTFTRSEYLGELIVPGESDLQCVCKTHGQILEKSLRSRGLVVL